MAPRPAAIRILMTEAFRDALAGPQRRVELRTIVVLSVVESLGELAHIGVLGVQRHVQRVRLWQPGSRWRWARARQRRCRHRDAGQAGETWPRQDRRRWLTSPADQEEQRCAAQRTQSARVVAHPRTARVHVTCAENRALRERERAIFQAGWWELGGQGVASSIHRARIPAREMSLWSAANGEADGARLFRAWKRRKMQ